MSEMKFFIHKTNITEDALDSLGHVNHAYYLTLFEYARWEILEKKNLREKLMKEMNIGPIILEANVKYRSELKLNDELEIHSRFEPYKRDLIFKAVQTMYSNGNIASEGEYIVSFMDLKERKMCTIPSDMREFLFSVE